jgi:hypothetical protein
MNILQPANKRHSRGRKAHLEYLDARIVPATVHPALAVAAEVASVHAGQQPENIVAGESATQMRHEQRIARLAERREAALERREMRAALFAARDHITLAGPVQDQVIGAASTSSKSATATQGTSGPGQSTTGSSPTGSSTGSNVGTSPVGSTPTPLPVTTPTNPAGSQGALPANVSALFDTIYEEYESGTLPASTGKPGQFEIQGSDVGVQIETSNSSEFSTLVADALSLGLQVTESSAAYNIVEGFLPISALPAAAQLPGSPSITPMLNPAVY